MPFIVGAERQPSPVEKKHIKRRSQVFPDGGGAGGLDRLEPKSLRSDAKFCNGNKRQTKKKTTPLGLHRSNGWSRFPWIPSIYSGTQKQHEQIQQAPWPATGGPSIWAVLHVAASAFHHHVLFHSFKDHRTEALGVSTPSTSAGPERETREAAPFFFSFLFFSRHFAPLLFSRSPTQL